MIDNNEKLCQVNGCELPDKGRGLCAKHELLVKAGDPRDKTVQQIRKIVNVCNYPGCEKKIFSRGLCSSHYFWKDSPDQQKQIEFRKYSTGDGRDASNKKKGVDLHKENRKNKPPKNANKTELKTPKLTCPENQPDPSHTIEPIVPTAKDKEFIAATVKKLDAFKQLLTELNISWMEVDHAIVAANGESMVMIDIGGNVKPCYIEMMT